MKNLVFICFFTLALISCKQEAKKMPDAKIATADSSAMAPQQATAEQLAAFYTGTLPCTDCDAIETLLTLNADEQRSFTLEEQYKGKENKTVETTGTWAVAADVVTLTSKSGSAKYQVTNDGLVSLNADGSKRDAESAQKYLLRKVMGE